MLEEDHAVELWYIMDVHFFMIEDHYETFFTISSTLAEYVTF